MVIVQNECRDRNSALIVGVVGVVGVEMVRTTRECLLQAWAEQKYTPRNKMMAPTEKSE